MCNNISLFTIFRKIVNDLTIVMNKYKSLYIISRMDTKTIDEINAITEKIRKIGLIPENIKKIKESLDKILEKVKAINAQILELTDKKNKLEADSATAGNKVEIARLTAQIAEYKEAILNIKNRLDNLDFTNLKLDEIKGLLYSINIPNISLKPPPLPPPPPPDPSIGTPEYREMKATQAQNLMERALRTQARYNDDNRFKDRSTMRTTRVGGRKLKRPSIKKSNKKSKKLKGGYLYRKRNKYQTLSSTRKSKQSKSKRKYFKY